MKVKGLVPIGITLALAILLAIIIGTIAITETKPETKESIIQALSILKQVPVLGAIIDVFLIIRDIIYRHTIEFVTAFIIGVFRKNPLASYFISIGVNLLIHWGRMSVPLHIFLLEASLVWLILYLIGISVRYFIGGR